LTDHTMHGVMSELATLRAEVATLKRGRRRRHAARRLLTTIIAAALVALVPLTVLADFAFLDLDPNSPHNDNITAIKAAGITKGCDPPAFVQYCPKDFVTREEMASFLARTAGLGDNPPVANARIAQTVPDGAITPGKLGAAGSTPGQVLTSTGTGVAFQGLPKVRVTERTISFKVPPLGKAQSDIYEVSCDSGEIVVGGGFFSTEGTVYGSIPVDIRWIVNAFNSTGHDVDLAVRVLCLTP
jgi:hypothetical protein